VLDLDRNDAREAGPGPVLEELVRKLLLDAVVALEAKTVAEVGLELGVGRLGAKSVEVLRKVPVHDHERVTRLPVFRPALWQQHVRAEMHRPTPEFRQQRTLDALVLDDLVEGHLDRG
jgi:hypothetical protein